MADDHYSRPTRPNDSLAHSRAPQASQSSGDPLAELARLIGHTNETLSKANAALAKGFPPRPAVSGLEPSHVSDRGYAPEPGYESGQNYGQDYAYDPRFAGAPDGVQNQDQNFAPVYDADRQYAPQAYQPPYGGQEAGAGYDRDYGQSYAQDYDQDYDRNYSQDRGQGYDQNYDRGYDPTYARGESRDEWPAEDRFSQLDTHAPSSGATHGYAAAARFDAHGHPYGEGESRNPYLGERSFAPEPSYRDQPEAAPPYGNPAYADGSYDEASYAGASYAGNAYDTAPFAVQPQGGPQSGVPQFASRHYDDKPYPAYDNDYYARQGDAVPPLTPDEAFAQQPGAHYDDPSSPGFGAPYYEPEQAEEGGAAPAPRRRAGLATAVAVFALAVVGTAAAFGYRSMFTTASTRLPPPVIKASTAPSKIVPATGESAKPIQDRVGDRAQTERLVNREEQPLDVNAARASTPRVVFPGPAPVASSPPAGTVAGAAGTPVVTSSTEPKKIRTVAIRSDQPEAPNAQGGEPAARAAAAAQQHAAPAATSAPLSLSPQSQPAPARTASIAPAAVAGGYSVQVTSQRSEREAQAAFATLQSKFPGVLGNRQALIRRADLGDKGIYYRAQIPFGSQGEAADFCTSLRNAGGQCVIQRN